MIDAGQVIAGGLVFAGVLVTAVFAYASRRNQDAFDLAISRHKESCQRETKDTLVRIEASIEKIWVFLAQANKE